MLRTPPDILITTPESLYLMLTSRAREIFDGVDWVIVDEIHAVAQTKRGAHLAITLERLERAAGKRVQRIGLSATQRPLEEVGRFLSGVGRECTVIDTGRRKELAVRTAFNLLGPLTNPAGATRQIVGVPRPELTELMARALLMLGSKRAWVVHGADGIDEITTTGYTKISECCDGTVNTFYLHPADVGLPKAAPQALVGGDAHENARIAEHVLAGERGPARDIVLLNAGAALFIAGAAPSVEHGIAMGSRAIDRGDARRTLDHMIAISTAEEFAPGATA